MPSTATRSGQSMNMVRNFLGYRTLDRVRSGQGPGRLGERGRGEVGRGRRPGRTSSLCRPRRARRWPTISPAASSRCGCMWTRVAHADLPGQVAHVAVRPRGQFGHDPQTDRIGQRRLDQARPRSALRPSRFPLRVRELYICNVSMSLTGRKASRISRVRIADERPLSLPWDVGLLHAHLRQSAVEPAGSHQFARPSGPWSRAPAPSGRWSRRARSRSTAQGPAS